MYVFLVLFLYTTVVKSNSDTKYIDLLPEKEKEEFLDKIARRILEEVETKSEKSGKSVEVSDSQLDKQNDFVHKILQEENENIRKQANGTYTLVTNKNTSNSPLALREDENKLQQYVDLTLRTDIDKSRSKRDSKRRVFTGYADEKSKEYSKESKGAESELDVQVRNFQQKSADNDDKSKFDDVSVTKTPEKVTTDQIKVKLYNTSDENNITQMLRRVHEENEHYNGTSTEKIEGNKNLSTVSFILSDMNQTTVYNEQSQLENEYYNATTTEKIEGNKILSTVSLISSNINQKTVSNEQRELENEYYNGTTTEKNEGSKNLSTVSLISSGINEKIVSNERSELETSTIDNTDNYFATEDTASEPIPYEVIQRTFHPLANTSFDDSTVNEHKIDNGNLRGYALDDVDETIILRSSNATKNVNVTEATPYTSSGNSIQRLMTTTESNEHANDSKVINIDVITVSPVETSIHYINENAENDFLEQTTPKIQVLTTNTGIVNSYLNISSDFTKISSSNNNTKSLNEVTEIIKGNSKAKPVFKNKIRNATKLLLNRVIESLRESLVITDKNEDKASVKPIQAYNVYEIATDATPFVKKDVLNKQSFKKSETLPKSHKPQPNKQVQLKKKPTNVSPEETIVQEEPYYVPIYNYQPKNAFYNPHEAFELNASKGDDDDDNDEKSRYGANTLPSHKSLDDYDNEEHSININNNNQPMQVPIYVYAPQNAFFDPNNNLGPNAKDQAIIKENDIDFNPEYSEEYEDKPERSSKDREQIEYQYYNDPHKKKPKNIKVLNIKNNLDSKKLTLINLTKFIKDLVLQGKTKSGTRIKNTPNITVEDILSKDLDWDSKKQKALLRCLYKKNCGQGQDSDEEDNNKEDGEIGDPDAGFDTAISKARHLMLLSGHYLLDSKKTNYSRLDEYFESAERVQTANSKEKIKNEDNDDEPPEPGEPGDNSRYKRAREMLRALLEKNDVLSRKPSENLDLDIAMDYYFDKPKITRAKKQKDIETPKIPLIDNINKFVKEIKQKDTGTSKIALILDKINKFGQKIKQKHKNKDPKNKEINEALRDKPRPKRKPDQYYEYLLIKKLADKIPEENIEKLYWQLEFIDKLNLRLNSDTSNSKELDVYVEVLEDMMKEDHKGLQKYDWLGTAVDLQTAIKKMMFMVEQVQNEEDIHPSDLELLKYLVWLHNFAKEELSQLSIPNALRGIKIPIGKKRRGKIIKESGLIYREWLNRIRPKAIRDEELEQFQEFVERLQNSLHDLHTALKYIGMVTKYKRQKWFENLKQIHLENSRKRIIELLIHLSSTRLITMIEESSKNGLEDNFKKYMKNHEKEVEKTKEEFVFVLSLIEEFEKLNT